MSSGSYLAGTEAAVCATCGLRIDPTDSFCRSCGTPLGTHSTNASAPPTPLIIEERKHISVLFGDIVGSTQLIENDDPERAIEHISLVVQFLSRIVRRYNGVVNRIEGDGIMALFGAPTALEGHAVLACQAALAIQDSIEERFNGEVRVRIGLCSGIAVLHAVQNDVSTSYEADGKAVVLARRMEQIAGPGQTLFTGDMAELVRDQITFEALGDRAIKGISAPVSVFRLIGLSRNQASWPDSQRTVPSSFVGRDAESTVLLNALEKAQSGHGQIVTITGEPGVGKSRFLYHILRSQETRSTNIWDVAADQQFNRTTYLPISKFLRSCFAELTGSQGTPAYEEITQVLTALDPELKLFTSAIASLMEALAPKDTEWRNLDPQQQRGQIVEAFTKLVIALARNRPCIAVFEDAHWMDAGSLMVLDHLARRLSGEPILLILTFRPEIDPGWADVPNHTPIHLQPLDRAAFDTMANELLGANDSLSELKSQLFKSVRGVPLFLEELVRSFADRDIVSGQPGNYVLQQAFDVSQIPPRVQTVMAARIDSLPTPQKTILQTAAVIGSEIDFNLLVAVARIEKGALKAILSDLVDRSLLQRGDDQDGDVYLFNHDLMREVTYRGLLRPARKQLHGRAVKALEATYGDRLDEYVDRMAEHAFYAENWPSAAKYHMRSMVRAVRQWANLDAVAIFERGTVALDHLPNTAQVAQAKVDVRLLACSAMTPLGYHRRQIELLEEADTLATGARDVDRVAAVNCQLAAANWVKGDFTSALRNASVALDAARQCQNKGLELTALYCTGMILHETGNLKGAIKTLNRAKTNLTQEFDDRHPGWPSIPSVSINAFLASSFFEMGDIEKAEQLAMLASERADAAQHAYTQTMAYGVRCRVQIERGQLDDALSAMQRNLTACRRFQIYKMYPHIAALLVDVHVARGEHKQAMEAAKIPEASPVSRKDNFFGWRSLAIAKGKALLEAGQLREAQQTLEDCLETVRSQRELPKVAACLKHLGDVHSRRRDVLSAETAYSEAMKVAQRAGMMLLYQKATSAINALAG